LVRIVSPESEYIKIFLSLSKEEGMDRKEFLIQMKLCTGLYKDFCNVCERFTLILQERIDPEDVLEIYYDQQVANKKRIDTPPYVYAILELSLSFLPEAKKTSPNE